MRSVSHALSLSCAQPLCTQPFMHSTLHALTPSCTQQFMHSIPHALDPSYTQSLTDQGSCTRSLMYSLPHALNPSFTQPFMHSIPHAFTPSCAQSLTQSVADALCHSVTHLLNTLSCFAFSVLTDFLTQMLTHVFTKHQSILQGSMWKLHS